MSTQAPRSLQPHDAQMGQLSSAVKAAWQKAYDGYVGADRAIFEDELYGWLMQIVQLKVQLAYDTGRSKALFSVALAGFANKLQEKSAGSVVSGPVVSAAALILTECGYRVLYADGLLGIMSATVIIDLEICPDGLLPKEPLPYEDAPDAREE